ncbi:MAG: hypothetical protein JSR58_02085 [Verrucomicrobia bacterium]|nr:hypothetical protein [Verrucomicrobiota bacterium]
MGNYSSFPQQPVFGSTRCADYISVQVYTEIQGLLSHTDILNEAKLDLITQIPPNNYVLSPFNQALGPKTNEGLIDWYIKNFLPIAEGSHQYLYVDTVGKITVGMGTNLSDRMTVFEYKDNKTNKFHYASSNPGRKGEKVIKFNPRNFLNNEEYKSAVLDKVMTLIKSFYVGKPLDVKRDNYGYALKASRKQLEDALTYLCQRIIDEPGKKAAAKKAKKPYHIPGPQSYVSEDNSVHADKDETNALEREFLEKMMPGLHAQVPQFAKYPAGAQLAVLDMAYNTNFYRWKTEYMKTKGGPVRVELHPFYRAINTDWVSWDSVAYGAKDEGGCTVADVAKNFVKNQAKCDNFLFWRKKIGLTRNIATQILLILADEWQEMYESSFFQRSPAENTTF